MNRLCHVAGLVWAGCIYAAGLGLLSPLVGCLIGAGLLAVLILTGCKRRWYFAAAAALCLSMLSLLFWQETVRDPAEAIAENTQTFTGTVEQVEQGAGFTRLIVALEEPLQRLKMQVTFSDPLAVRPGNVVSYRAKAQRAEDLSGLADGILLTARPQEGVQIIGNQQTVSAYLGDLRMRIRQKIEARLTGPEGSVVAGMVTGETFGISPELRYAYSRAGTAHLLAVSGLHLSILTGLLDCLLAACQLSRKKRGVLGCVAILLFLFFTGFAYSVVRAGIMAILCRIGLLLGRDTDSRNALGFALLLLLAENPCAAYSVSLQLSYLATLGIATFASPWSGWICNHVFHQSPYLLQTVSPGKFAVISSLATTCSACLLTTPVLILQFGQLSLLAPVVNLLVALPATITLACGMLCGIAGVIPGLYLLHSILAIPAGLCARLLNQISLAASQLSFAAVPVQDNGILIWFIGAFAIGALLSNSGVNPAKRRYAACLLALSLGITLIFHAILWRNTVTCFVPENGESIVVVSEEKAALLGTPGSLYEARNLCNLLRDRGIQTLELAAFREKTDTYGDPAQLLLREFPASNLFALDTSSGFEVNWNHQISFRFDDEQPNQLLIRIGGLQLIKTFDQRPVQAHLLINRENQLIAADRLTPSVNRRYYSGTAITFPIENQM